jgi:hypothetical protein
MKSGILILLENSGPAQTCNGIALPFTTNKENPAQMPKTNQNTFCLLTSSIEGNPFKDM